MRIFSTKKASYHLFPFFTKSEIISALIIIAAFMAVGWEFGAAMDKQQAFNESIHKERCERRSFQQLNGYCQGE